MNDSAEVRMDKAGEDGWQVWVGRTLVAKFLWVGDALDLASLLELSPRARNAAAAAAIAAAA